MVAINRRSNNSQRRRRQCLCCIYGGKVGGSSVNIGTDNDIINTNNNNNTYTEGFYCRDVSGSSSVSPNTNKNDTVNATTCIQYDNQTCTIPISSLNNNNNDNISNSNRQRQQIRRSTDITKMNATTIPKTTTLTVLQILVSIFLFQSVTTVLCIPRIVVPVATKQSYYNNDNGKVLISSTIVSSLSSPTLFQRSLIPNNKLIAFGYRNYHSLSLQQQQQSRWKIFASTTDNNSKTTTTTTTTKPTLKDGVKRSSGSGSGSNFDGVSERLRKAKILLEQFEQGDEETLVPPSMMLMAASDDITKTEYNESDIVVSKKRTTTGSRVTINKKSKSKSTMTTISTTPWNAATPIVPDTYWRQGNLPDFDPNTKTVNGDTGDDDEYKSSTVITRWARGANVAEPLVQYDPVKAERLLFRQPAKWVVRNFQIAVPLGWWAVNVVADYFLYDVWGTSSNDDSSTTTISTTNVGAVSTSAGAATTTTSSAPTSSKTSRRRMRAQQLTKAISSLGPAIIKGGQALASRPDLLPAEYLEELQKLQDDVPRFSNELAIQTVEQELGITKFTDVFELIQSEPVAAASIGQVYKARLIENGDIVALKIQRPKCEEIVALDLYILRWWSGVYNQLIFRLLNRDIDLQNIIDDFGILIYRELDYIAEASNAQRFNELYAAVSDVFVPKIYSDYTTSRVLTMEWVDGYRITDTKVMDALNLNVSKLVNTLVQCSLRQILENGFFHADPHAGNLLACPDGRLCYLDFGMMSYANQKQRNGFLLAVVHIINRDWDELAKLYVKLGFIPVGTDLAPIVIALEQALPDVLNADISELNLKNVINSLGDVFYTFPFSLPPFYIAIIRCLGVLEGLAIQVDPSIKILSECYPYVASRVLTDRQEDLQEAFRRLVLTNDGRMRWDRLEGLLDQATDVSDYNAAAALDVLADYALADDDSALLDDLAVQVVNYVDTLSTESGQYVLDALKAFAINDEVAAVRSFRALANIAQPLNGEDDTSPDAIRKRLEDEMRDSLPEMKPSMKRLMTISSLLLGSENEGGKTSSSLLSSQDPTKFVPIIRKLTSSPKVQQTVNEIVARLGERLLSRTLRNIFGLPPPSFGMPNGRMTSSTVTEDRK